MGVSIIILAVSSCVLGLSFLAAVASPNIIRKDF